MGIEYELVIYVLPQVSPVVGAGAMVTISCDPITIHKSLIRCK